MDQPLIEQANLVRVPWVPSTRPIRVEDFKAVVDEHPIIIIHLWAAWNQHDRTMDRAFRVVIPTFEDRIEFRSFNVDQEGAKIVCRRTCVMNQVPALSCFLYGQRVETVIGLMTPRELERRFEGWLRGVAARPILYGQTRLYSE